MLQNVFTVKTWAAETPGILLLQLTPTGPFGNLDSKDQTSTQLFPTQCSHSEDV